MKHIKQFVGFWVAIAFVLCLQSSAFAQPISGWSMWEGINGVPNVYYRIQCDYFNQTSKKYVWTVQIRNDSNKNVGISVSLTDGSQPTDWRRDSHIPPGGISEQPIFFIPSGPGPNITFWSKDVRFF